MCDITHITTHVCVCVCVCVYVCVHGCLCLWHYSVRAVTCLTPTCCDITYTNTHVCVSVCVCVCMCVWVCVSVWHDAVRTVIRLSPACDLTGWQRPIWCRILTCHFLQKNCMISGSFAERDLQLKRHCRASLSCMRYYRVATTNRMPRFNRSFPAKEPCYCRLFGRKRPAN